MDNDKVIDALRKARKYIRTVEAARDGFTDKAHIDKSIKMFTAGGEIVAIEEALAELGVVV